MNTIQSLNLLIKSGLKESQAKAIIETIEAETQKGLATKEDIHNLENRLIEKIDSKFMWMVSIQFATLLAIIALIFSVQF